MNRTTQAQASRVFESWLGDWEEIERETEATMKRIVADAHEAVNRPGEKNKYQSDPITGAILHDSGV